MVKEKQCKESANWNKGKIKSISVKTGDFELAIVYDK